jgi:glycosyltransferase involved in cell wall biosynthesis
MSVLVVTNTYPTADEPGATPCIQEQMQALAAHGVQTELCYIDYHYKISYLKAAWKLFLLSFQPARYDLIHAHYGYSGLVARLQWKYPVVVTFHGSDLLHRREGKIGKLVSRLVEGVVVMTEQMKRVTGRADARVIPFGVDAATFRPYPQAQARRELGLPLDKPLMLFPWNPARAVKRFDLVQEAVRLLQQTSPDVALEVVFDKPRQTIARYMQACDVMVVASEHEGSPMAVREAMACDLPIVSVDVGDIRQVIEGIEGCYLCQRDAPDIAAKVQTVLNTGRRTEGAQAMSKMGTAWAAQQVIALYQSILSKRGAIYDRQYS